MPIHIGKKIQEEVYKQGISITGFAKKINKSRNVVYNIFNRESVDTNLLNTIGKVLHCDFFSLYSAQKEYTQEGVKTFILNESGLTYIDKHTTINSLMQQNQALKNEIVYLKKIISLYENENPKKVTKKKNK